MTEVFDPINKIYNVIFGSTHILMFPLGVYCCKNFALRIKIYRVSGIKCCVENSIKVKCMTD